MTLKYSQQTGDVFIRAFDQGLVERLLAYVADVPNHPTVGKRRGYWVDLPTGQPTQIPVIFNNPEQIYEQKILPSFLIAREAIEPAMQRWHSVKQLQYVHGVPGTEETVKLSSVSGRLDYVSGYSQIETKVQAYPFDIFYAISVYARYEHEAIPMVKHVLRRLPPYSRISVVDTVGDIRRYSAFLEGGVADLGEFSDVTDRTKAYQFTVRVEAELDLTDPVTQSTMLTSEIELGLI